MVDLLQVAAMLALPMLVVGALVWLLIYTGVRLAIRHEVKRLEHRKARSERAAARGKREPAGPRLVRTQPMAARTSGHARPQPAAQRPATRQEPVAAGARRRSAS
jgi:hypothetical protein